MMKLRRGDLVKLSYLSPRKITLYTSKCLYWKHDHRREDVKSYMMKLDTAIVIDVSGIDVLIISKDGYGWTVTNLLDVITPDNRVLVQ